MASVDTNIIKEAIINFLKNNGPSLPIPISRYLGIDSLFTSAFLSELLSEQKIKLTTMRVGGSPVYYLPGNEKGLEKYSEYLKSKEKEAYNRLKENSFLEDEKEHPAIRVALREIKDFAKSFEKDEKIIWRYFLIPEENYKNKNLEKQEEIKEKPQIPLSIIQNVEEHLSKNSEKNKTNKEESIKKINEEKQNEKLLFEKKIEIGSKNNIPEDIQKEILSTNPLSKKEEHKKKEKSKSEFVLSIIKFIEDNNWKIIKEHSFKTKEYNCLVEINSDLGPIIFYTQAKNKKTISEEDLSKILIESQSIPLPALILSNGEIQKKANEFLEKYKSILKFKKIN